VRAGVVRVTGVLLALALVRQEALAQSGGATDDVATFADQARAATERYRDQSAAVADGYRRIGPDFPTMGEHWLSASLVVHAEVDPLHPPILEYVTVAGKPVLAGVAYTQLVHGALPQAPIPAPANAWHFHQGSVDEESFVLSHAAGHVAAEKSAGPRIGVLHAWLWLENPAGLFATDNWALPWRRMEMTPPEWIGHASPADLAAALAAGGERYFTTLLRYREHLTPEQSDRIGAALKVHAREIRALLEAQRARPEPAVMSGLSDAWSKVEADLRTICASCTVSPTHQQH
jgi:hypothetical protein